MDDLQRVPDSDPVWLLGGAIASVFGVAFGLTCCIFRMSRKGNRKHTIVRPVLFDYSPPTPGHPDQPGQSGRLMPFNR